MSSYSTLYSTRRCFFTSYLIIERNKSGNKTNSTTSILFEEHIAVPTMRNLCTSRIPLPCILIPASRNRSPLINLRSSLMSYYPPLIRMPVLSRRGVPEIREGAGESGNGDRNSLAGGTPEKSTRHHAGRQGTS